MCLTKNGLERCISCIVSPVSTCLYCYLSFLNSSVCSENICEICCIYKECHRYQIFHLVSRCMESLKASYVLEQTNSKSLPRNSWAGTLFHVVLVTSCQMMPCSWCQIIISFFRRQNPSFEIFKHIFVVFANRPT